MSGACEQGVIRLTARPGGTSPGASTVRVTVRGSDSVRVPWRHLGRAGRGQPSRGHTGARAMPPSHSVTVLSALPGAVRGAVTMRGEQCD